MNAGEAALEKSLCQRVDEVPETYQCLSANWSNPCSSLGTCSVNS